MGVRRMFGMLVPLGIVTMGAFGWSSGLPGETPRTLVTARQVHDLSPDLAKRAYPVHLRAILTSYDAYIDPRRGGLFVCDHSGCVFVSIPARPVLPIKVGDLIEVNGVSGPGDYASIVDAESVPILEHAKLAMTPRKITMDELMAGTYDSQWIQIECRVRAVHFDAYHVVLELASEGGNGGTVSAVSRREPGANYDGLVDSVVRITANAAPVFNQRRQMVSAHLFFPSLDAVRVVHAAPGDPFAAPAIPVANMFRYSPGAGPVHRVHVRGTLTLDWPGRMICIQDANAGTCMQTTQDASLRTGSSVDVVGFPIISMFKSTLEEAEFRGAAGFAATSRPVFVTAQQAIKGDFDGRLVQMDGELVGQDLTAAEPSLLLRSGGMLFPATLPRSAATGARLAWKEGSLLRITGICNTQVDSTSISMGDGIVRQSSMHILLRSSGDVLTLKAPSWWTPRHTLEAFAVVGLLAFAAITWIAVLRRRVRQQTQALRDSEGRLRHLSEHDALTGLPNRILLNDRLGIALARATRFKTCLGLLMVDVDGFKGVNDALGHQAGDDLLRELACRLSACVRTTDTVARIGGDEFIVLLPDLRIPAEAEMIAAKILAAAARPMGLDQARAAITVSIGVVTDADGSSDAEALMQNADQAMYAAKKRGKNSFQVHGPELAERNGGTERVRQGTPRTSFLVGGA